MLEIALAGHRLHLLPEKAVFLPDLHTLVLADTHFGKSATFRARGLPVPEGDTAADLARIAELVETTAAERLVVAGDLLHAPDGKSPAVLDPLHAWISSSPAQLVLVSGNHDDRAGGLPPSWEVPEVPLLDLDGLVVVHKPDDLPAGRPGIAAHLHPLVRVKDGKNTALRLPVFWLRDETLVLPSFGTFTGGQIVKPQADDRIFTPLREAVVEIPAALR